MRSAWRIRTFLVVELLAFALAASIHHGWIVPGYAHFRAAIAESVIAALLLIGLVASWVFPAKARTAGLSAQALALVGTAIGVFVVIIGVGPQTVPDMIYHAGMVVLLVWGLAVAARAKSDAGMRPANTRARDEGIS